MTVVARINNCLTRSSCVFCAADDRESDPDLYVEGTYDWVCPTCAADRDPDLADAVDVYRRALDFAGLPLAAAATLDLLIDFDPVPADVLRRAADTLARRIVDSALGCHQ